MWDWREIKSLSIRRLDWRLMLGTVYTESVREKKRKVADCHLGKEMDFRLRWKFTHKCVIFSPSSDSFLLKPLCAHPIFLSVRFDPGASLAHALCASDTLFISPKPQADESASVQKRQLLIGQTVCLNVGGGYSPTRRRKHKKYHVWSCFFM